MAMLNNQMVISYLINYSIPSWSKKPWTTMDHWASLGIVGPQVIGVLIKGSSDLYDRSCNAAREPSGGPEGRWLLYFCVVG